MIISFDEVVKFSDLPSRILSNDFKRAKRLTEDIEREFEEESWSKLLEIYLSNPELNLSEIEDIYFGKDNRQVYYFQNKFHLDKKSYVRNLFKSLATDKINSLIRDRESILELGAGYGAILKSLSEKCIAKKCKLIGAELSASGRRIIEKIGFDSDMEISSCYCNFFVPEIDRTKIEKVSLVYSSYSLMYLEKIDASFIDFIVSFKANNLIFIEPVYENFESLIHGDMCKKYLSDNSYNKTILSDLINGFGSYGQYELVRNEENFFGSNPFLPASVLLFKKNGRT